MSKIVLIPDSFKGTMSSGEICSIMKHAILRHLPTAEIVSIPGGRRRRGQRGRVSSAAMGGRKNTGDGKRPLF